MTDAAELRRFYDRAYDSPSDEAQRYAHWRALGAIGKADHVVALCRRGGLSPAVVVEVGCGDGALLSELSRRGFAERLEGFEITEAAAELARQRSEIEYVGTFDGERLPVAAGAYDLGILSHVLEHVPDPPALLGEVARISRAVVLEVPLEENVSARRRSKRAGAAAIGHLQRFDRSAVAGLAYAAGLRIEADLVDPLPLPVHRFFAATSVSRARATLKWALRCALMRTVPGLASRLFTLHYACLCVAADDSESTGGAGVAAPASSSESTVPNSSSGTASGSASF